MAAGQADFMTGNTSAGYALAGFFSILVVLTSIALLVISAVRKKPLKKWALLLGGGVVVFVVIVAATPSGEPPASPNQGEVNKRAAAASPNDAARTVQGPVKGEARSLASSTTSGSTRPAAPSQSAQSPVAPAPAQAPTPAPDVPVKIAASSPVAKASEEAIQEWIRFRSHEKDARGTLTTWRFKCSGVYDDLAGYLDSDEFGTQYRVIVTGPSYHPYSAASYLDKRRFPTVKKNDIILVTGKFKSVTEDSDVVLSAVNVVNEGYAR